MCFLIAMLVCLLVLSAGVVFIVIRVCLLLFAYVCVGACLLRYAYVVMCVVLCCVLLLLYCFASVV